MVTRFAQAMTGISFEQCSFGRDSMRKIRRGIVRHSMKVSGRYCVREYSQENRWNKGAYSCNQYFYNI